MEGKTRDCRALLLLLLAAAFLPAAAGTAGRGTPARTAPFRPLPADPADRAVMPLLVFGRIDVNTASRRTLARIPGIGPARAGAIVALRERLGGFGSLAELAAVRGMGRATAQRLGRWLAVGKPAAGPSGRVSRR